MPEATTDTKGIKKLPKWGYIAIGGGVLIAFFYLKKKKEETPSQSAYTAQSFIPVTGENVAGVGASTGGGGGLVSGESNSALIQAQKENTEFLTNFLKSEAEGRREERKEQHQETSELLKGIIGNQTGGGAPGSGQIGTGGGSGGGGSGATGTTPPSIPSPPIPRPSAAGCPNGFPKHNPKLGPPSCKSCYRTSREPAKKKGYEIHGYCDGHEAESLKGT